MLVREPEPALLVARAGLRRARRRAPAPRGVRRRARRSSRTRTASSCRTSAPTPGRRRAACALLRATRTQLEPLFFLWDGAIEVDGLGEPDLQSGGDSLWRLDPEFSDALVDELADAQLLIADGHHRYETTLASGEEWLLAVIVPTGQEGLTIFPTHRLAQSAGGASGRPIDPPRDAPARTCPLPGGTLRAARRRRLSRSRGRRRASHRAASPTRRSARRPSPASIAARRRRRFCCAPRGSRTSGPSRGAVT